MVSYITDRHADTSLIKQATFLSISFFFVEDLILVLCCYEWWRSRKIFREMRKSPSEPEFSAVIWKMSHYQFDLMGSECKLSNSQESEAFYNHLNFTPRCRGLKQSHSLVGTVLLIYPACTQHADVFMTWEPNKWCLNMETKIKAGSKNEQHLWKTRISRHQQPTSANRN